MCHVKVDLQRVGVLGFHRVKIFCDNAQTKCMQYLFQYVDPCHLKIYHNKHKIHWEAISSDILKVLKKPFLNNVDDNVDIVDTDFAC